LGKEYGGSKVRRI
jgi:hypothetical protein